MKQLKSLLSKIRLPGRGLAPRSDQSGQSLIILAFIFVALLAMLGLALDLGLVYVERIRLKRTVDAAALAAVAELPVEEAAANRALNYMSENGYDVVNANVYIAGCVQDTQDIYNAATGSLGADGFTDDLVNLPSATDLDTYAPVPATLPISPTLFYHYATYDADGDGEFADEETPTFYIDTRSFQSRDDPVCDEYQRISVDADNFGSASKIKIYGQIPVRMNFMQFFGFPVVIVSDEAVAESASSLDVVVVMDTTGSMEFDTICYGCWARCDLSSVDCDNPDPTPDDDEYSPYPSNGRAYPFPYPPKNKPLSDYTTTESTMYDLICGNGGNCTTNPFRINTHGVPGSQTQTAGSETVYYIIIEAEFYTNNNSVWDPAFRSAGRGYWAIQRNPSANARAIDGYGYLGTGSEYQSGLVRHHPYVETSDSGVAFGRNYTPEDVAEGKAPRLDYNFRKTWSGNAYAHLRTQYFSTWNSDPKNRFFWAVDSASATANTATSSSTGWGGSAREYGAAGSSWSWITLDLGSLSTGDHILKIWAGSPGLAIDRIIISNKNSVSSPVDLRNRGATPGSAQGLAADVCNPIFGLNVLPSECTYGTIYGPTNNLNNALFDDLQPIRGSQEAIKSFVTRLDPNLDQAGFVSFASSGTQRAQLECMRSSRARDATGESQSATYPGASTDYDELNCADVDAGTVPISYTVVIRSIEDAYPPDSDTDIADGLRQGLHTLGVNTAEPGDTDGDDTGHDKSCDWSKSGGIWQIDGQTQPANVKSHCDRGQAATPVLVLLTDGAPTNSSPGDNNDCKDWGNSNPKPYEGFPISDDKYECIMYYADFAADNGVIVYTIGLGAGVDQDLLKAVADVTHGQYYFAPSAAQLDIIFDQILGNVYVRLIQ